jgi:hypothetical protein
VSVTESQPAEVGGNPADRTYEAGVGKLAAALAAVQQELPRIGKTETGAVSGTTKDGRQYSYEYKYADLASVAAAVLPLLGKNGLAFTAWPTTVDGRLILRYHLLHESGEHLDGEYPLPSGGTAQQLGSAITYARRYCLCAVTGVAPDEDDDAAKADGARQAQQAEDQAAAAAELNHARDAVRGAWAVQFGEFDQTAAGELFRKWSKGGTLTSAPAGHLRAFAAYLHALPPADAGSSPDTDTASEPPADGVQDAPADRPMSRRDQGHMFVLFEELGMKDDRARQLEYLTSVLGRTIKSRGELLEVDAPAVLTALKADRDEARRTGMSPSQPAAAGA